jgi:hypothetical protein
MGYWKSALPDTSEGFWGDAPADQMDNAIAAIVEDFKDIFGRKPTKAELRAGLEFSLGAYEEGEK